MINQYSTLVLLVEELQSLVETKIIECFTQEKGSLIITFYNNNKLQHIQFITQPQIFSLFKRNNFSRANRNTIDLFPKILGEIVKCVNIIENERIIEFQLLNYSLYAVLFGASKTNLYLVDKNNIINDSFKHSNKYIGNNFSLDINKGKIETPIDSNIFDYIAKGNNNLGKFYTNELLLRLQFDSNKLLSNFSDTNIENINRAIVLFKEEIMNSKNYYLYITSQKQYVCSAIPLQIFSEPIAVFNSISQAIEFRVINTIKEIQFYNSYEKYTSIINKAIIRVNRILDKVQNAEEIGLNIDKYKLFGEILISQPDLKLKGMKEILLNDWNGNIVKIPLQKDANLQENAAKYFNKAKNAKDNLIELKRLVPELLIKKEKLEKCSIEIQKTKDIKGLQAIISSYKIKMEEHIGNTDITSKFRTFDLGEGFILYVGKNAKSNDLLTMKFAKPNDIWFHARGAEGSHTLLKCDKKANIPKKIIEKAAQIAAYYSKARNAKYTPVCYTLKKYIHKPKGANPGAVVVSREEVIMVEPKLVD